MATTKSVQSGQAKTTSKNLESVIAIRAHYKSKDGSGELIYTYRCADHEARTDIGARYMAEYIHAFIKPAIKLVRDKQKLQLVEISTHELLISDKGKVKKEYTINRYDPEVF